MILILVCVCVKMFIMDIEQQDEIKNQALGWTDAHKDAEGKNSTIYHPDLAVKGAPGSAQEGQVINPGMIVDVAAAQDIANVMNEQSIPAGLAREKQLEAEAKTGLTEQQREYVEIMDNKLRYNREGKPINTHAFREVLDSKGRKYMVLHMTPRSASTFDEAHNYVRGAFVVMTKDGPVSITISQDVWRIDHSATEDEVLEKMNLDELGDRLENPEENGLPPLGENGSIKLSVKDETGSRDSKHYIYRYDLSDAEGFKDFARAVKISEYKGAEVAKKAKKMVRASDVSFG